MIFLFSVLFIRKIFIIVVKYIATLASLSVMLLWVALLIAIANFITRVTLLLWQVQKQALQYGVFSIGKSTSNVLLSILFIVGLEFWWEGRIHAQIISGLFFKLLAIV